MLSLRPLPKPRLAGPVEVITPPVVEPLPDLLVRQHLRLDADSEADSEVLALYAQAARLYVETRCGLSLMKATYRETWRNPGTRLYLQRRPVISITSVHEAEEGVYTALVAGDYYLDGSALRKEGGGLVVPYGLQARVTYMAGFSSGDEAEQQAAVPADLKAALLYLIAAMYEERTPYVVGTVVEKLPVGLDDLLRPWLPVAV
jgi:uncharacterized phiE125 gp8 family phage protein